MAEDRTLWLASYGQEGDSQIDDRVYLYSSGVKASDGKIGELIAVATIKEPDQQRVSAEIQSVAGPFLEAAIRPNSLDLFMTLSSPLFAPARSDAPWRPRLRYHHSASSDSDANAGMTCFISFFIVRLFVLLETTSFPIRLQNRRLRPGPLQSGQSKQPR